MADEADITQARKEREDELLQRQGPYHLPDGYEGDCSYCGEFSRRLIGGACAPCRDKRGLP